jgi:cytochrome c-type biogenesis protein CcmH
MNFWIIAVALLAVSAAIMCWPLFTGPAKERASAILIVLLTPAIGLVMYQNIGTPEALGIKPAPAQQAQQTQDPHASSGQQDVETLVAQLQQRMNENPEDPDGWLILGRTLKTMQRFAEAETALANANRLAPGNPLIMVELAETRIFASAGPDIPPGSMELIESALEIDPQQQKGQWLLGMILAQEGNDARAIEVWQGLLAQLEPGSGPAQAVTEQIQMAQTRTPMTGMDAAPVQAAGTETAAAETPIAESPTEELPVAVTTVAESGIPVTITLANEFAGSVPGSAALFIFIHPRGGAGMPLAVKRVAARGFPISMNFSDADLLMPGGSLADHEQLDITARISMGGIANAATGDIQADKLTLDTNAVKPIALNLNKRVP